MERSFIETVTKSSSDTTLIPDFPIHMGSVFGMRGVLAQCSLSHPMWHTPLRLPDLLVQSIGRYATSPDKSMLQVNDE